MQYDISVLLPSVLTAFTALMLLVGQQEGLQKT